MDALLGIMLVVLIIWLIVKFVQLGSKVVVDMAHSVQEYDQQKINTQEPELPWREEHLRNRKRYYGHE
jgi:biopolymer transport protein ExbD